jgi:hypothetical protein
MEKIFYLALLVIFFFTIAKVLEMKYIDKEWKPVKDTMKEITIVFVCSIIAAFIMYQSNNKISDFFNTLTDTKTFTPDSSEVFTGQPGF